MPYNNALNQNVSNRLNTIYLNHIRKEDQSNDDYYGPTNYDIVGQYEHAATLAENPDIVGMERLRLRGHQALQPGRVIPLNLAVEAPTAHRAHVALGFQNLLAQVGWRGFALRLQ